MTEPYPDDTLLETVRYAWPLDHHCARDRPAGSPTRSCRILAADCQREQAPDLAEGHVRGGPGLGVIGRVGVEEGAGVIRERMTSSASRSRTATRRRRAWTSGRPSTAVSHALATHTAKAPSGGT